MATELDSKALAYAFLTFYSASPPVFFYTVISSLWIFKVSLYFLKFYHIGIEIIHNLGMEIFLITPFRRKILSTPSKHLECYYCIYNSFVGGNIVFGNF